MFNFMFNHVSVYECVSLSAGANRVFPGTGITGYCQPPKVGAEDHPQVLFSARKVHTLNHGATSLASHSFYFEALYSFLLCLLRSAQL